MYEVSPMEVSMIANMMLSKTSKEIATVMELPVEIISRVVKQLAVETGLTPRQVIIDQNRKPRVPKKKAARIFEKPVKEMSHHSAAQAYHEQRRKENDRRKFITVPVDLNKMISVRIDEKTTIFIKPGEDALQAKINYLDREKD